MSKSQPSTRKEEEWGAGGRLQELSRQEGAGASAELKAGQAWVVKHVRLPTFFGGGLPVTGQMSLELL